MNRTDVRTRFAPSPTGNIHIGNLRTALYEYLIARSVGGRFILRIEDTDQERLQPGAVEAIYRTLRLVGLQHDEGPDIGGPFAPYIQSERLALYPRYAEKLVQTGKAYYCFCSRERLEELRADAAGAGRPGSGYDRHCRDLTENEVERRRQAGHTSVIRQKMPLSGSTSFTDSVYGKITVENSELEDQVLLKSDGFPTYNFANVIDDHEMQITHVVRGSEYLSSTPKYNLLYEAFGWEVPTYVHLPLILGNDGRKLSKRHGSVSFEDLLAEGYLPQAVVNCIALLGWCPHDNREIFSLQDLCSEFSVSGISKSPSVFDYEKLAWFNGEYIRKMTAGEFIELAGPYLPDNLAKMPENLPLLAEMLQPRVTRLTQIPEMVQFLAGRKIAETELYLNKKSKSTPELAAIVLPRAISALKQIYWSRDEIHDSLVSLARDMELKTGQVMWPVRVAISGQAVTPGGAIEILVLLGRKEAIERLEAALAELQAPDQAQ